jgi:hypothetical protein
MEGGEISGNTAQAFGGGVMIDTRGGSKFIKTGGTIDAANSAGTGSVVYALYTTGGRKRDSAAGPDVSMDSDKYSGEGGWE